MLARKQSMPHCAGHESLSVALFGSIFIDGEL